MYIRKSKIEDFDAICKIYEQARGFMRKSGNAQQWGSHHPPRDLILQDIQAGKSHVCVCSGGEEHIAAVFYFAVENDPTYSRIDGQWLKGGPYGVVHRIARGSRAAVSGIKRAGRENTGGNGTGYVSAGEHCLLWCFDKCKNLRIDTHRDNEPMKNLLERLGFKYCGIIWLENGDERMAYQKV